jgi:ATP-dependent helicase HrpA
VYRGFVTETGWDYLGELPRYLKAIEYRLDRIAANVARDRQLMATVEQVWQEYEQLRDEVPPSDGLRRIRWMVEELRVSLFAQALGTPYPVSDKRIYRAMDDLAA